MSEQEITFGSQNGGLVTHLDRSSGPASPTRGTRAWTGTRVIQPLGLGVMTVATAICTDAQ